MRYCANCGEVIEDKSKYCNKCGKRNYKRKNMAVYFMLMVLLFIVFDFGSQIIYSFIYKLIDSSRYGTYFIIESIWAAVVFIVMLLAGNAYIFDRKQESLFKSIILAVPPIVISGLFLILNFNSAYKFNPIDVGCLFLFCLAIGVTEEFMCRGWLLTEFLERYGYDRKHVRLSIICSALVFGFMHLTNILTGQSVFETILQVIQTIGMGYLMGTIFYRTRNIWSVVIVHAVYDFSIMLSEISSFNACTYGTITTPMMIQQVVISMFFAFMYIAVAEIIFRKVKVNHLLPRPKELTKKDFIDSARLKKGLIISIIIVYVSMIFIPNMQPDDYEVCTVYPKKEIKETYYLTSKRNTKNLSINHDGISLSVVKDEEESKLYHLVNNNTGDQVVIYEDASAINVIANENYFVIAAYSKDNGKITYNKFEYSKFKNDSETLNSIVSSGIEFVSPTINSFVTITFTDRGEQYIAFTSEEMPIGMIDSDNQLYEIIEK